MRLLKLIEDTCASNRPKDLSRVRAGAPRAKISREREPTIKKAPTNEALLLTHYVIRFYGRLHKLPNAADLDCELAQTLVGICGGLQVAQQVIDKWFDSSDSWFHRQGFQFVRCFSALNRLVASGEIEPQGADQRRRLQRRLAQAFQDVPITKR